MGRVRAAVTPEAPCAVLRRPVRPRRQAGAGLSPVPYGPCGGRTRSCARSPGPPGGLLCRHAVRLGPTPSASAVLGLSTHTSATSATAPSVSPSGSITPPADDIAQATGSARI